MDPQEYFDALYRAWSLAGGSDAQWFAEETEEAPVWQLRSIREGQPLEDHTAVGVLYSKEAVEFITWIHTAIPEIVEKAMAALDEAERADLERDQLIGELMELELEMEKLRAR